MSIKRKQYNTIFCAVHSRNRHDVIWFWLWAALHKFFNNNQEEKEKQQRKQKKIKYSVHHDIILPLVLRGTSMQKLEWF